jgi:hypothetical protein
MSSRAQLFLAAQRPDTNAPAPGLVALGWNPSPDINAAGYFLCWGLASDACTNRLDVGHSINTTVAGLAANVAYYFRVVAYGAAGQESPPSNEISHSLTSAAITLLATNVLLSVDGNCQALMPDLTGTNYTLAVDTCVTSAVLTQSVAVGTVMAQGTNQVVLTLTDGCGNSAYATNFVIVLDTTPPVLEGLPLATASYQCESDVPPAPTVTATGGCDGPIAVNYLQSESNPGASCGNIITRTWTATDRSGNTTNFTQTIAVNDSTPPILIKGTISPWYATLAAAEAAALAATGMSDNCTTAAQLARNVSTLGNSNATVTVSATDGCGNTASVIYDTHIDNRPPVIQTLPQAGGKLTLTWSAIAGQKFQVQFRTNCNQTDWMNLGDPIPATNANMAVSEAIGPAPQRFYRVLIVP